MKRRNEPNSNKSIAGKLELSRTARKAPTSMKKTITTRKSGTRHQPTAIVDLGLNLDEIIEQLQYPYSQPTTTVRSSARDLDPLGQPQSSRQWPS